MSWCKRACLLVLLGAATAITAAAQTLTTLVSFDGANGAYPEAGLVQGIDGNFYGTTNSDGTGGFGTAFRVSPDGALTTLYDFCLLGCPVGGKPGEVLTLDGDGNLYGTALVGGTASNCPGGCGTAFRLTPAGALTTIYSFCAQPGCTDGSTPAAALELGRDGAFYSDTYYGGSRINGLVCSSGCGIVYKLTPQGGLTSLYEFCNHTGPCSDGYYPSGALVLGRDGNFYGTTIGGGTNNAGTVFKITPGGSLRSIYSFCAQPSCADGQLPVGGLTQGRDGNFYGVTAVGGANGSYGTVFRITPEGTLTTLHSFCALTSCADGDSPLSPLVLGADGNFYGATYGGGGSLSDGGLFKITPGGTLTVLHTFSGSDGQSPIGLFQATNGLLYGATTAGGAAGDYGTVFTLDVGLRPSVQAVPRWGRVGERILILGTDLAGATSVSFNGTPASFTVGSRTFIKAAVPAGAVSGEIAVSLPAGTLTSNVPFQVLP